MNRSTKYAQGWLEYGAPVSKRMESEVQVVPFRDDVFDAESPPGEWQPGSLSPETDDREDIASMFKQKWQEEIDFWKKQDKTIPEYIYDLHGIAAPAEGAPCLTAEEAHDAFQRGIDEFRKERDADPAW